MVVPETGQEAQVKHRLASRVSEGEHMQVPRKDGLAGSLTNQNQILTV